MRDISGYNIKQAMKEIDENEYLDVLNEIAQKRIDSVNETNSFKKRRKVFDYLYRKGFETALINEVLNELMR